MRLPAPFRFALPVAAAATACALLTGCDTSPGAAALVGGDRISSDALQQAVARALAAPQASALGADRVGFARSELSRMIHDRVVAAASTEHHVTVTTAEIDRQIQDFAQQAGGLQALYDAAAKGGVPRSDLRSYTRYYVLEQKLGDALVKNVPVTDATLRQAYESNIKQFQELHAAHILVTDKATADRLLAQVRARPSRFAALARRYSQDTGSKANGGDLGFVARTDLVAEFGDAAFAVRPGQFTEAHSQFGWHVIHVIATRTKPLSAVRAQLESQIRSTSRDRLLGETLARTADRLGVHVNPRYGRWNAQRGQVVPIGDRDAVSSPSPAPGGGPGNPSVPVG